jgi:hypothetical protein
MRFRADDDDDDDDSNQAACAVVVVVCSLANNHVCFADTLPSTDEYVVYPRNCNV